MKIGKGWAPEKENDKFRELAASELKILLKHIFDTPKTHYLRCKVK